MPLPYLLSVVSNLLAERVKNWLAARSVSSAHTRAAKLERELARTLLLVSSQEKLGRKAQPTGLFRYGAPPPSRCSCRPAATIGSGRGPSFSPLAGSRPGGSIDAERRAGTCH